MHLSLRGQRTVDERILFAEMGDDFFSVRQGGAVGALAGRREDAADGVDGIGRGH